MGDPKGLLVVPIGFGPTDLLRSLELDADDNLKVAFAAAAQGLVGEHGWISGAWQKNPLAFGYSERLSGRIFDTALVAGTTILQVSVVPAGEIWVLTSVAMLYIGTSPTYIQMFINDTVALELIARQPAPVSDQLYDRQGWWVLKAGDNVGYAVVGATLNDDLYGYYFGFRVDIDQ